MHGSAREPGQALTGAALSVVGPVPPVSWPPVPATRSDAEFRSAMAYTVLARRYRSQSFDQVVGQEPIARTLRNAIATGRVAHAYLFTGTRGVGKTSMARIFARALNAPDTVDDAPKPDALSFPPEDVQQRMAQAIMQGQDLNVIEIDGASNNSVDNARQLIANAGLTPTGNALYKVYIIDEVHMLSGAAFNALLKTMEEPPSHVKFILCTTEPHKVPATIQSRCQRFDFRNIATARIADHLRDVLKGETVEAEESVIWQIARLGNGSMRDALSLMDRLLATGQSPLTPATLEEMFGLPDEQLITDFIDALADGNAAKALEQAGDLLGRGIGQDQLVEVLIERLRNLMLLAACGPETTLVELSEESKKQATEQAARFDAAAITYMIALCENLARSSKSSSNARALLDATVVRLALAENMADVAAVLKGGQGIGKAAAAGPKKKVAADTPPRPRQTAANHTAAPGPVSQAPETTINITDPAAVWSALRDRVADRPGLAWVDQLDLKRLQESSGVVSPKPGNRDVARFATESRLEQLASELQAIVGRRIRLTMQVEEPGAGIADDTTDAQGPESSDAERREALNLPLVKRVIEAFPDATLTGFRRETPGDE